MPDFDDWFSKLSDEECQDMIEKYGDIFTAYESEIANYESFKYDEYKDSKISDFLNI